MKTNYLYRLAALLALSTAVSAQTATPANAPVTPPCAANVTYNYFAEEGVTYGTVASTTTGFGVRIGCSNAFSVTDIDTTIGQPLTAYSTLRTGIEYVAATSGFWSLTAFAAVGATTSGSVSFAGGGGVECDIGKWLSKGKFSVLADAQVRIAGVPGAAANVVAKSAGFMFRKTF